MPLSWGGQQVYTSPREIAKKICINAFSIHRLHRSLKVGNFSILSTWGHLLRHQGGVCCLCLCVCVCVWCLIDDLEFTTCMVGDYQTKLLVKRKSLNRSAQFHPKSINMALSEGFWNRNRKEMMFSHVYKSVSHILPIAVSGCYLLFHCVSQFQGTARSMLSNLNWEKPVDACPPVTCCASACVWIFVCGSLTFYRWEISDGFSRMTAAPILKTQLAIGFCLRR